MNKEFILGKNDSNRRFDRVLRKFLQNLPLSVIYKHIRCGDIKINGKKNAPSYLTKENDVLQIAEYLLTTHQESDSNNGSFVMHNLHVIFENEHLVIINKPYDIPVHHAKNAKYSVVDLIRQQYSAQEKSLSFSIGALHRLDRQTTGLLVFSKSLLGAQWFSASIKKHHIKKVYLGILCGNLQTEQFWEEKIQKEENQLGFSKVTNNDAGKIAQTDITPIAHGFFEQNPITMAKITIVTGKTHQIRFQSAFHGYPLLGDTAYGGNPVQNSKIRQKLFLHASELYFPPENILKIPEKIECPLNREFECIASSLSL